LGIGIGGGGSFIGGGDDGSGGGTGGVPGGGVGCGPCASCFIPEQHLSAADYPPPRGCTERDATISPTVRSQPGAGHTRGLKMAYRHIIGDAALLATIGLMAAIIGGAF
jgi:hypothetical protein